MTGSSSSAAAAGLEVWGRVEEPASWTGAELAGLPEIEIALDADGTGERRWRGIAAREVLGRVRLGRDAAFVLVHGPEGAAIGLPLATFAGPGVVFARRRDGEPLAPGAGGPLRFLAPGRAVVDGVTGIEVLAKPWSPGTLE